MNIQPVKQRAQSRRRGFLTLETLAACALMITMLVMLSMSLLSMANGRRALLHRTIAEQALVNSMERIDSWPGDVDVDQEIASLRLPGWAQQQLPQGNLNVSQIAGADESPGRPIPLQPIQLVVSWRERTSGPQSQVQCVMWRPISNELPGRGRP